MGETKRRAGLTEERSAKKIKVEKRTTPAKSVKALKPLKIHETSLSHEDEFEGEEEHALDLEDKSIETPLKKSLHNTPTQQKGRGALGTSGDAVPNGTSSREAHAKQKALAEERRAAKPNADSIKRSKKLWERLRRKSHVPKEERDMLVKELFEIITGRVKEYVFKHDCVRVIQCALKYAAPEQKKQIAKELLGSYRELAESKYAKFLVAKLVMIDDEVRDMVVPEFYGHVKRLIRQPEASWIMDDIYRGLASQEQKAVLLREWYGPEFVVFRNPIGTKRTEDEMVTDDLATILKEHPEKRTPIMQHLKEMTNQLVQKKTTGFTMLHDALLQYFLNCKPGSPEATELLELLKDDEEGDCYRNLAFTKSGSRLVCLALAYGNSKDRKTIVKFFKTHIKLLASDRHGHHVLLTAYEVIDDTVMTAKSIFPELLSRDLDTKTREQELLGQVSNLTARIPLLWPLVQGAPKWLVTDDETKILDEVREIRALTSKKDPEIRRVELAKAVSQQLLDFVSSQAPALVQSSFGCQFVTEVLLGSIGEKQMALEAIAAVADGKPTSELLDTPHIGRMLKILVQGGFFDKKTESVQRVDPPLKFHDLLYKRIIAQSDANMLRWASSGNSFVVVGLLESSDFSYNAELKEYLQAHVDELQAGNAGARIIAEKFGGTSTGEKNMAKAVKGGKGAKKSKQTEPR